MFIKHDWEYYKKVELKDLTKEELIEIVDIEDSSVTIFDTTPKPTIPLIWPYTWDYSPFWKWLIYCIT